MLSTCACLVFTLAIDSLSGFRKIFCCARLSVISPSHTFERGKTLVNQKINNAMSRETRSTLSGYLHCHNISMQIARNVNTRNLFAQASSIPWFTLLLFSKEVKLWFDLWQSNTYVILSIQPISVFRFESKKCWKPRIAEVGWSKRNKSSCGSPYTTKRFACTKDHQNSWRFFELNSLQSICIVLNH